MAKMGRPLKEINWNEFDKLCNLQCTEVEIASWFDVSVDTIERAVKRKYKVTFAEHYKKARQKGLISLRRALWNKAVNENNTATQIFLAKVILGYRETINIGEDPSNKEDYSRPDSMKAIENL